MNYDTDDFAVDVIERSYTTPVLVDFWAAWCGPCRILGPVLEKLSQQAQGGWALVKLDTEKYPQLAAQYGIRSIPAVKLFVDGQVIDEFVGAMPEPMILQWLEKALPSEYQHMVNEAERRLVAGDVGEAQRLLEAVLEAEPGNNQARVLLAKSHLLTDPQKALAWVERIEPGTEYADEAEAVQALAKLLTHLEDTTTLPDAPVKATYVAAIQSLKEQDFGMALEGFIKVIERNRAYDDDGSRKACVAIFKLLGEENAITQAYRSRFSSALFS